jgi:N-acetylneuraminic acid mutarotase
MAMIFKDLFSRVIAAVLAAGVTLSGCGGTTDNSGSSAWMQKAPLPIAMAEVGVAALDGKVYVIGGAEQKDQGPPSSSSTSTMAYDPVNDTWQKRAPLPNALSHVGVAALDGKLYAIGGFVKVVHIGPQNLAFVYDPVTDKWSVLPDSSSPLGSVAVAAASGKIHIFGGRTSDRVIKISPPGTPDLFAGFGTVTTHKIYDPKSGSWSLGAPIPGDGRDHMGIATVNDKIHLFGGRTADLSDNLDRHDVYDPATNSWASAAPLPRPRSAGAYTVLNGLIIYAGGECSPGGEAFSANAFDDVTAYDFKTDRWITLESLPQARHAFGAAMVDDVAYFAGGAPVCGGGTLTDMLSFSLLRK